MKNKIWALGMLFIFLAVMIPSPTIYGEPPGWSDDARITEVDNYSSLKARIAIDSQNNVHLVYNDYRHGPPELYYSKLDPSGNILVDEKVITDLDSASSNLGDIVIDSQDDIHVVWSDVRDTGPIANLEIYYEKLDKYGDTLLDETRITFAPYYSVYPSIAIDSQDNLHLAWAEEMEFGSVFQEEIFYMKLDNYGTPITDAIAVTESDGEESLFPDIQVDSQDDVHIVWLDDRNESGVNPNQDVFYSKLDNNGNLMVDDTRLFARGDHFKPSLTVDSDDMLHLVCGGLQNRNGNEFRQIYYMKLNNAGDPVGEEKRLTNDDANATHPVIAISKENEIHIVWEDERHTNNTEIYYMKINDNGMILEDELRLTDNLSKSQMPQVALDHSNNIKVVWNDGRDYMDGDRVELYHKQKQDVQINYPPTVSITKPDEGTTVSDGVTIQGTASDYEETVDRVDVKIDSGSWKTATGTTSWSFIWNSTLAGDGKHEVRARSFDGIQYSEIDLINVTVNNTKVEPPPNLPPEIRINTKPGTEIKGTFSIQGTASDPDGGVQKVLVRIDQGGWGQAQGTTSWSFLWDSGSVSDGEHVISAKSEDNDGDQSQTASITLIVNNTGNTQPFVDIITPSDPVSGVVQIHGTATDPDGDGTIESVSVNVDGIWQDAQGTASWTYTWDTSNRDDGVYTISARAFDGSLFSDTKSITVTVDNPRAPGLSIFSDIPKQVSGTLSLHGTSSDEDGEIETIEIQIDDDPWTLISNSQDWSYELDTRELSNGMHTIRIKATDDEGEQDTVSLTFSVENEEEDDLLCQSIMTITGLAIILIILVAVKRRARRRADLSTTPPVVQHLKCPQCGSGFTADVNQSIIHCPECGYGAR